MFDSIEIEELIKSKLDVKIIDIRDNYQYNIGNIPGSINVPMNFILMNPNNYLDKKEKYYIYCEHGSRSTRVCSILTKAGYSVVNIIGGYNAYKLFVHKKS